MKATLVDLQLKKKKKLRRVSKHDTYCEYYSEPSTVPETKQLLEWRWFYIRRSVSQMLMQVLTIPASFDEHIMESVFSIDHTELVALSKK
jgi:hypothetical protein